MSRYKLVFFSPIKSTPAILQALFTKFPNHVGRIGEYEQCAFISVGTGQFKPIGNAHPFCGSKGELEQVEEHRVEVLVKDELEGKSKEILQGTIRHLKEVHPYEEVAYEVYRLEDF